MFSFIANWSGCGLGRAILVVFASVFYAALASADTEASKAISFSGEVQPLLTKLGCASLECHGAFRGQADFRLSLFGRQRQVDYDNLVERVDLDDPDASWLLQKPTEQVEHGGGKIFDLQSADYKLLAEWVKANAPFDERNVDRLRFDTEKLILDQGDSHQLRVYAVWDDGRQSEVTNVVTFTSLDGEVVSIEDHGSLLLARNTGAARIVGRMGTTAAHAVVVVRSAEPAVAQVDLPGHPIDRHIEQRLAAQGVLPSELCSDNEFIRRVMLDSRGRIPTQDEVRTFVADPSGEKRARFVEQCLESSDYARRWGSWLAELSGAVPSNHDRNKLLAYHMKLAQQDVMKLWVDWFAERVGRDEPYDEIIAGWLLGTTCEDKHFLAYMRWEVELRNRVREGRSPGAFYASRKTNDLFWRAYGRKKELIPKLVAESTMGIQLECAECHDHPMDFWRQADYNGFAAIFEPVNRVVAPDFSDKQKRSFIEQGLVLGVVGLATLAAVIGLLLRTNWYRLGYAVAGLFAAVFTLGLYGVLSFLHVLQAAGQQVQQSPGRWLLECVELASKSQGALAVALIVLGTAGLVIAILIPRLVFSRCEFRWLRCMALCISVFVLASSFATSVDSVFMASSKRVRLPLVNYLREWYFTFHDVRVVYQTPDPRKTVPTLLDRTAIEVSVATPDPRIALVDWLRLEGRQLFARNLVNRIWAEYFGRGLVDPPHDMSALNPPTHPDLLDWLAQDFIDSDFSFRRLHRQILTSAAYQRSSRTNDSNQQLERTYARFEPRRLGGRHLLDALCDVTGSAFDQSENHTAFDLVGTYPQNNTSQSMAIRVLCTSDTKQADEMRAESAMLLMVNPGIRNMIVDPRGTLSRLLSSGAAPAAIIESLYLRSLARLPTEEETRVITSYTHDDPSLENWHDVLWALINTEEFQFVY